MDKAFYLDRDEQKDLLIEALKKIAKEARKARPNPDLIYSLAMDAIDKFK